MRTIIVFLSLFALAAANTTQLQNNNFNISEDSIKNFIDILEHFNRNEVPSLVDIFADIIFDTIQVSMVKLGIDPLTAPDIHEGFNYTKHYGNLDLIYGELKDISTIRRDGPVKIVCNTAKNSISVIVPIVFDTLFARYDYGVQIIGLNATGGVKAKIIDLAVDFQVTFDFSTCQAVLDRFDVKRYGHIIDFRTTGTNSSDWLHNLLVLIVPNILHRSVISVITEFVRNPVERVINLVNEILQAIFDSQNVTVLYS